MPVPEISPAQLAEALRAPADARPLLLDVRQPHEHAWVALPHARLIPLHELEEHADELAALAGRPVVVYCHHGVRSLGGAAFLRSLGVDAVSLAGGIDRYAREVDPSLARY